MKKKISVITSCYNEQDNLIEFYERVKKQLELFSEYEWEIIVADNCSTDNSRNVLKEIAKKDKKFKVIFNSANFGHIRSPMNALFKASGDAVINLCSDLQEPPEMISTFIKCWKEGYKVVCGVKPVSKENPVMFFIRKIFYKLINFFSDIPQIQNFTGFGLYDRSFVEAFRSFDDPYPYFRGIVSEIGLKKIEVPYIQEKRKFGKTKNNFFTLYDMAMTGFVNHTQLPLRLAAFTGFSLAGISFLVAVFYFFKKILNWDTFDLGLAPLVIGLFLFSGIQLIFIGILGEYLGAVWLHVRHRPLVIEEERINFEEN